MTYVLALLVLGLTHSVLFWPLVNFAILAIGEMLAASGGRRGARSQERLEG